MPEMVDKIYGIILGDRIMIVYEVAEMLDISTYWRNLKQYDVTAGIPRTQSVLGPASAV